MDSAGPHIRCDSSTKSAVGSGQESSEKCSLRLHRQTKGTTKGVDQVSPSTHLNNGQREHSACIAALVWSYSDGVTKAAAICGGGDHVRYGVGTGFDEGYVGTVAPSRCAY